MINKIFYYIFFSFVTSFFSCETRRVKTNDNVDKVFTDFEAGFLDAYWKQYPSSAIFAGYGKYYEKLVIPDSASFAGNIAFSKQWLDSLAQRDLKDLSDNNKISLRIIKNQLESDIWYQAIFRSQEWDASLYNLGGECDYILTQPYAPLEERLKILTSHLQQADEYYKAALNALYKPTREHVEMAVQQNQGSLSVFGTTLTDSIKASHLTSEEKLHLKKNTAKTITAINNYINGLKSLLANKNTVFRSFRIGKKLYGEKFKYDLATDFSPAEIYKKASEDKKIFTQKMIIISGSLWKKYYGAQARPADSIQLVQMIIDKVQLRHATAKDFFDSLTAQVYRLKRFIIEKNLFGLDTSATPILVRLMPEYARGFTVANAQFTPPYQKQGPTYFNIDDLTQYTPEKAAGTLREYNNYTSQLLSIHEAVPGHCMQGIYNNKKSPDVVRAVFANGAMIEGWAVYTETMMFENGWGAREPEMELMLYKMKLRELANVLIDYNIQCLNTPEDLIIKLLSKECFQTRAQAEEKYHRATVSQVQLCSYYAGATAILALRDEYKNKMGDKFKIKDFHETFLSFGSSPVKYIRERMLR